MGSIANAGALSVNWNTSGLTPAPYTLRAYATDTTNNWSQTDITVNVTSAANTMRVTDITLSGKASGNRATITGDVTVKDSRGQAIPNANVAIRWTLPGGATQTATALTGSNGRARFTVSGRVARTP